MIICLYILIFRFMISAALGGRLRFFFRAPVIDPRARAVAPLTTVVPLAARPAGSKQLCYSFASSSCRACERTAGSAMAVLRHPSLVPPPLLLALLLVARTTGTTTIPRVHGGGACSTDEDCQLNGRCAEGKCACLPAWEAAHCQLLATRPTRGPAHAMRNVSSWGGRSLRWEKDGLYHGFFSEFSNSCGMDKWDNNSRVVHMTSKTAAPAGGYRWEGVAIPSFAHCVDTVRLADGRWLMFHNGDGAPRANCGGGSPDCPRNPAGQWLADCSSNSNGTTPPDPVPAKPAPPVCLQSARTYPVSFSPKRTREESEQVSKSKHKLTERVL